MHDIAARVIPVNDIEWTVRARKAIRRLNCLTLDDLTKKSEEEFLALNNFGMTTLNEIRQTLKEHDLCIKDEKNPHFRTATPRPETAERVKIFSQNHSQTLAEFEKEYSDWMTSNQANIVILDRRVSTTVEYNHDRTNRLTDITIFYRPR